MLRRLALAGVLAALAPASAGAVAGEQMALSDRYVPFREAADGVVVTDEGEGLSLRLGPAAAGDYRRLAGRRVSVDCLELAPGGIGAGGVERAPARRTRFVAALLDSADVCTLATAGRTRRPGCPLRTSVSPRRDFCVRMVIALTDAGRAHVDEVARAFDLVVVMRFAQPLGSASWAPAADVVAVMGGAVAALDDPAATPPPGIVGYWTDGATATAVTVTAAGLRRYLTIGPDERSTNALGLLQLGVPQIG